VGATIAAGSQACRGMIAALTPQPAMNAANSASSAGAEARPARKPPGRNSAPGAISAVATTATNRSCPAPSVYARYLRPAETASGVRLCATSG
jgi:hypothetical protein